MKIQVGKTYKNGFGRDVYIEHQLSRSIGTVVHAGLFMGVHSTGGWDWFNKDGTPVYRTANEQYNLIPNKVKKAGWVNVYNVTSYPATYPTGRSCVEIYESEQEAKNNIQEPTDWGYKYLATVPIEWEEEE